jgi:type II secretory pathway pseudopilin PulG
MIRRVLIVIVLMALSFAGGYLVERGRSADAQAKLAAASTQLSMAQATIQLYQLQGQLLTLIQETGSNNYGDAAARSTKFFDDVRAESTRTTEPDVKSALESVLNQRDAVTTALAKGDPKTHDQLLQLLATFRQVLGKTSSVPPPTAAGAAPPAATQ